MNWVIEVEKLHYFYPDGTHALRGLSLKIPGRKRTTILGPNGAGKSTLLYHLNGIYLPQQGTVKVLEKELSAQNEKWVRGCVGLVFQDPDDQIFAPTVWEEVAFGPLNLGWPVEMVEERVTKSLQSIKMEHLKDKVPYHLSFGQKKRIAIAGVLAMDPQVIILDEPTSYLDPQGQDDLMAILNQLSLDGQTIVMVTHDVDLAAQWADQVIIIKDGKTLAEGGKELLVQQAVLAEAGLHLPITTRLFKKVPQLRGYAPANIEEAARILQDLLPTKIKL